MRKRVKDFCVGLALGLLREFFVVQYFIAIQSNRALFGTGLTFGIGCFDLMVIARMTWQRNLYMAAGYVLGESIGTFVSIVAAR